ncbi:hypothetical protein BX600DRAFT_455061 [Xylariales sp. PMI_506]|nr:hypothetical protein BX600DRAFT_455061 [Xylariales sp. PMI_506]
MAEIKVIPSESLPAGAVELPKLGEPEKLEAYQYGADLYAFVVYRENESTVVIANIWLSAQDAGLAQSLLDALKGQHLRPGWTLNFIVKPEQVAILEVLKSATLLGERRSKSLEVGGDGDGDSASAGASGGAEGLTHRSMTDQEANDYIVKVENKYAEVWRQNSANPNDTEAASKMAKTAIATSLPQGAETPGHLFLIVEAEPGGDRAGLLWIGFNEPSRVSYCYDIEIDADKRRRGFGRKALVTWERIARDLGAASMGLSVFGNNKPAQALYQSFGFKIETAQYSIKG